MAEPEPTVFVVDDDDAICESLQWLLEAEGLRVTTFASAEAFLAARRPEQPGCLVLDVRMRGMTGLELQARLAQLGDHMPVIVVTGHGDVPMAVRAVRAGALDFLEKPVNNDVLLARVRGALAMDAQRRQANAGRQAVQSRLDALTAREREVLELVVAGRANKQIAAALGIHEKTVEVHRRHLFQKLRVHSTVELVRLVMANHPAAEPTA